ncbi:MAG TPA: inositol monophosphatase, partial [Paracoccus solventivorans]
VPFGAGKTLPATLKDLARLMPVCAGVRRWGSAALDMAYVAAGRYDGYWERGIRAWDVGAGILLVREAGGFVEPLRPFDGPLADAGNIVCANPALFEGFAGIVRSRD